MLAEIDIETGEMIIFPQGEPMSKKKVISRTGWIGKWPGELRVLKGLADDIKYEYLKSRKDCFVEGVIPRKVRITIEEL